MSGSNDPRLRAWLEFYDELGLGPFFRDRRPPAQADASVVTAVSAGETLAARETLPVKPKSTASQESSTASDAGWAQPRSLFEEPGGPVRDKTLEDIRTDIGDCTRCKLHKGRTNIVFGSGSPRADLVFVGEGPGADEDAQGLPFVGRAGRLLTKWIESMGMTRDEVYICNVIKCRPPGNRAPERDEIDTCSPFLFRQLDLIRPRLVCCLGATALKVLLGKTVAIGKMRGQFMDYRGAKMIPLYHPAYLLRPHSPQVDREIKQDLKKIRDFLQS